MFDPRQLLEEASATGDDQAVVDDLARRGVEDTPALPKPGRFASQVGDSHTAEEVLQREPQVLAAAQTGWDPDQTRVVDKLRPRADHGNLAVGARFVYPLHSG